MNVQAVRRKTPEQFIKLMSVFIQFVELFLLGPKRLSAQGQVFLGDNLVGSQCQRSRNCQLDP